MELSFFFFSGFRDELLFRYFIGIFIRFSGNESRKGFGVCLCYFTWKEEGRGKRKLRLIVREFFFWGGFG